MGQRDQSAAALPIRGGDFVTAIARFPPRVIAGVVLAVFETRVVVTVAAVVTRVAFFGKEFARALAANGQRADLIIGNNVLAQVPDLNDFVAGLRHALKDNGVLTLEFPHLLRLIEQNEFDTIYHEHFSYFSLLTTIRILATHGLRVFDLDELPSHGGCESTELTLKRRALP